MEEQEQMYRKKYKKPYKKKSYKTDTEEQRAFLQKIVKRRAMHILERQDRTESQLRTKLKQSEYPEEMIEEAIEYVKSYHYIDDYRYACNYISYRQEVKSRTKLKMDLMRKGVSKEHIDLAMEESYESEETALIEALVRKKGYSRESATPDETRKMYAFLYRKGFKGDEIKKVLKYSEYLT